MALGGELAEYIAFLRGINVGGHRIKMPALQQMFVDLKFKDVSTFIASGNVVFSTRTDDPSALEDRIEKHLLKQLGYEVPTFLRTFAELREALNQCDDFSERAQHSMSLNQTDGSSNATMMVGFVKQPISKSNSQKLKDFETETDAIQGMGREIYWLCNGRISDSKVPWPKLNKLLAIESTFRNATTLNKLAAQYEA